VKHALGVWWGQVRLAIISFCSIKLLIRIRGEGSLGEGFAFFPAQKMPIYLILVTERKSETLQAEKVSNSFAMKLHIHSTNKNV